MALSEELQKLDELRQRGVLSDEEFARAKARLLSGEASAAGGVPPGIAAINSFRRSASDRWLGGVCGGIARSSGIESWICRLIFAALFFFGGVGVVLYLLLWIFVPAE